MVARPFAAKVPVGKVRDAAGGPSVCSAKVPVGRVALAASWAGMREIGMAGRRRITGKGGCLLQISRY